MTLGCLGRILDPNSNHAVVPGTTITRIIAYIWYVLSGACPVPNGLLHAAKPD